MDVDADADAWRALRSCRTGDGAASERISGVVQCLPAEAEGLGADASVILEVIRIEGAVLKRESNVRRLLYGPRTVEEVVASSDHGACQ